MCIRDRREYERAVVFRLGRLVGGRGPGLFLLVPIIDRMVKVSLRTVVLDVPTQDVITRDNVSVKVNAVVYFRVFEADKAIVEVCLLYTSDAADERSSVDLGGRR